MEKEQIQTERVKILNDKKQYRITIPADIVKEFEIDPENDSFEWITIHNKEGISLHGNFIKGEMKGEEKN